MQKTQQLNNKGDKQKMSNKIILTFKNYNKDTHAVSINDIEHSGEFMGATDKSPGRVKFQLSKDLNAGKNVTVKISDLVDGFTVERNKGGTPTGARGSSKKRVSYYLSDDGSKAFVYMNAPENVLHIIEDAKTLVALKHFRSVAQWLDKLTDNATDYLTTVDAIKKVKEFISLGILDVNTPLPALPDFPLPELDLTKVK